MSDIDNLKNFEERLNNLSANLLTSTQFQQASWQKLTELKDLILGYQTIQLQSSHANPLNRFGNKCFSQTDEDGITLEIIRRLGLVNGVYAEFGVGNGLENNTLILASIGWKGFWVGGEDLAFNYGAAKKFRYTKDWITLENITSHAKNGLSSLDEKQLDVISLDLDGNDIYFVEELLSKNICPKLFLVEYNAKFIPPSRFQIEYNPQHQWIGDDYFGAALTNFVDMFEKYEYELICCNSHTGANAFFIHKEYLHLFSDVPKNIYDMYVGPRYYLYSSHGHRISAKVVETIINQ
jgi:hypothetical protein